MDLFASQYGWTLHYTWYNVYPEDYFMLRWRIKRRRIHDRLLDLAIAHNPHNENPQELAESFQDELKGGVMAPDNSPLDKEGLNKLKSLLGGAK